MGPIEYAVFSISTIVKKKYNDDKLADEIRAVASNCNNAGISGDNGFSADHPQNKAITKITNKWRKDYKI